MSNPSNTSSDRNRSSNRNRNRNRRRNSGQGGGGGNPRNRNNSDGNQGGGGNRNRNRNRNRRRGRKPQKPPTLLERILYTLTLGHFGKPPLRTPKTSPSNSAEEPASKSRNDSRPKRSASSQKRDASEKPAGEKPRREKPRREPEQIPVTNERLYVGNLDYEATEGDLYDLFNGVGQVKNAEVVCHRYNQRSKGYAFVVMGSVDEAKRAVEVLHDQDFMGRKLWVSGAKSEGPAEGAEESKDDSSADQDLEIKSDSAPDSDSSDDNASFDSADDSATEDAKDRAEAAA